MQKFLIVTADDFGLHSSINKGIELAIRKGVIKNISFATNTIYFGDSLKILRQYPDVSVGVHLNITDGEPLSSPANLKFLLNDKEEFLGSHLRVIYSVISHLNYLQQIKLEFGLQIKRLLDNNINVSCLNSHGHIHMIPSLFKIVSELALKFNIPFVRIPKEKLFFRDCFCRLDILGVNILSKYITRNFRNNQFKYVNNFSGLRYAGKFTKERLIKIIKNLDYGMTEIVVHPGYEDHIISKRFKWNYLWHNELSALMDNEVKEEIRSRDINLINFH